MTGLSAAEPKRATAATNGPPAQTAADPWHQQTAELLRADPLRLACLQAARDLQLPDWYLAAGFLRNVIWDAVHRPQQALRMTPLNDIDLVFFQPFDCSDPKQYAAALAQETQLAAQLQRQLPTQCFEVRNQARMHLKHGHPPYLNCTDGIRRWVELPTCVGVRLTATDQFEFAAPYGLALNWSLQVQMNADFPQPALYRQRIRDKGWQQLWPQLQVQWPDV